MKTIFIRYDCRLSMFKFGKFWSSSWNLDGFSSFGKNFVSKSRKGMVREFNNLIAFKKRPGRIQ